MRGRLRSLPSHTAMTRVGGISLKLIRSCWNSWIGPNPTSSGTLRGSYDGRLLIANGGRPASFPPSYPLGKMVALETWSNLGLWPVNQKVLENHLRKTWAERLPAHLDTFFGYSAPPCPRSENSRCRWHAQSFPSLATHGANRCWLGGRGSHTIRPFIQFTIVLRREMTSSAC